MTAKELGDKPAFPFEVTPGSLRSASGMTLREHIATEIMKALVANGRVPSNKTEVAECAISYADELLAELSKCEL